MNLTDGTPRKRKALVFDCDGTLVDSIPKGYEATCRVFRHAGVPPPAFQDFFVSFCSPADAYYRERGVTLTNEKIWEIYLRHADHYAAELFPDTMAVLKKIVARADEFNIVYFGVVSSNKTSIVRGILKERGIDSFFDEIIGDVGCKSAELARIATTHGIERSSVIWVGDFPCDMRDGSRVGVTSIGISRGMPGLSKIALGELLIEAGANQWIDGLGELENIFSGIL